MTDKRQVFTVGQRVRVASLKPTLVHAGELGTIIEKDKSSGEMLWVKLDKSCLVADRHCYSNDELEPLNEERKP